MSKKMKLYSAEFKAKIVIELLGCDITLNELASKYAVTPKSIQNWKKQFLANAKLAFNADSAVSEFKEQLKSKDAKINELHRQLENVPVNWSGLKKSYRAWTMRQRAV